MRGEPLDAETIVSATEEVLRRHGPDKATVLDVARLLGVSHGSVYRHFPSKMALREAVIRRWLDRVEDLVATAQSPEQTPPDRLRALLTAMCAAKWAKAREDPELFATFRMLVAEDTALCAAHLAFLLARIRDIVADGIADSDFADGEPETIAQAVLDATDRFHDPAHAEQWCTSDTEAQFETVMALILNGLRAR